MGKTETDPRCSGVCGIGSRSGYALFLSQGGPTSPEQVQVLVIDASRLPRSFLGTTREANAFSVLAAVIPP